MAYFLKSGVVPGPQGQGHSGVPEQGIFNCQDGRAVLITPMSEKIWPDLCGALGRPDLARDETLATRRAQIDRRVDLRRQFEAILLTAPPAE